MTHLFLVVVVVVVVVVAVQEFVQGVEVRG
jgi:hypothetical protein